MTDKERFELYVKAYKEAADTFTTAPCPGLGLRKAGLTEEEINALSDEEYTALLEKWRKSREKWRTDRAAVRESRQGAAV